MQQPISLYHYRP